MFPFPDQQRNRGPVCRAALTEKKDLSSSFPSTLDWLSGTGSQGSGRESCLVAEMSARKVVSSNLVLTRVIVKDLPQCQQVPASNLWGETGR